MKRSNLVALAIVVALLAAGVVLGSRGHATPSVANAREMGLRALYLYLEGRGHDVALWRRPPGDLAGSGVETLVIAAPFVRGMPAEEESKLADWVADGGRLVLLAPERPPDGSLAGLLFALDLFPERSPEEAPLAYSAWRRFRTEAVPLRAAPGAGPRAPDVILVRRAVAEISAIGRPQPIYVDERDAPMVFAIGRGEGEIVVVNNGTLASNGLVGRGANLAFLEWLLFARDGASAAVHFDEWRHGQTDADLAPPSTHGAFEILFAHAVLIYVLALVMLGRRFGRPLADEPPPRGSAERDVRALAHWHRRAKHATEVGAHLLAAARRVARRRGGALALPETFSGDERDLLALARRVGALQRDGKL